MLSLIACCYLLFRQGNAFCVVVTTTTIPPSADPKFFGPASYHEDDYPFFYNNLKENVAKRIAAYKAK